MKVYIPEQAKSILPKKNQNTSNAVEKYRLDDPNET